MQKLSLLGNVFKVKGAVLNQSLLPCMRLTARSFATGGLGGEKEALPVDLFLQKPTRGSIYGKLTGIGKNTLKTDIIHYLEGCDLTTEDEFSQIIRIGHAETLWKCKNAVRSTMRKGRLYKLEEALLSGIPRSALAEDVERFLSYCDFDASSLQMFIRAGFPEPIRMAMVRFPSQIEATNAISMKNRSFILNTL